MREVEINVNVCLCSYYCGECVCINYAFDGATDAHVLKVVKVVKVLITVQMQSYCGSLNLQYKIYLLTSQDYIEHI